MNTSRHDMLRCRALFIQALGHGPAANKAVSELVEQFRNLIDKTARAVRLPEDQLDDLRQDLYLLLVRKIDSIAGGALAFPSWLRTAARRAALKRLTKQNRFRRLVSGEDGAGGVRDIPDTAPTPESLVEDDDFRAVMAENLRDALAKLAETSASQAETVRDHYYGALSVREIAEKWGVPVGTVQTRLFHGRRKLETILRSDLGEDGAICL